MGPLRRVTGVTAKSCSSYRNLLCAIMHNSSNEYALPCSGGHYSSHSHTNEGNHTRLFDVAPLRARRPYHWCLFTFSALLFTPALLCAPSVEGYAGTEAFENDTPETAFPFYDAECAVSCRRLPRLVRRSESQFMRNWVPLKASAWLFPNSSNVAPADARRAAKPPSADPLDYTVLPLPLITDEVEAVRLTVREVMIKGRILETADKDWRKAVCLAIGLENLETRYHSNGEPEPPVLPLDWDQTQKILLRAAGVRCRVHRRLEKVKRRCVACFAGTKDDDPGLSTIYSNNMFEDMEDDWLEAESG